MLKSKAFGAKVLFFDIYERVRRSKLLRKIIPGTVLMLYPGYQLFMCFGHNLDTKRGCI
jgi:hypothetical protein